MSDSTQHPEQPSTDELEQAYDVKVYVYDLSRGLASVLSPQILGVSLDAIYHTSIVIYDKEYYIDQGIKINSPPGTTKYGTPIEIKSYGKCYITPDILDEFLQELRTHPDMKYSAEKYHLFDNNCNHFTSVMLEFLTGNPLDEYILELPQQVLNTPNGQLLRLMLEQ